MINLDIEMRGIWPNQNERMLIDLQVSNFSRPYFQKETKTSVVDNIIIYRYTYSNHE